MSAVRRSISIWTPASLHCQTGGTGSHLPALMRQCNIHLSHIMPFFLYLSLARSRPSCFCHFSLSPELKVVLGIFTGLRKHRCFFCTLLLFLLRFGLCVYFSVYGCGSLGLLIGSLSPSLFKMVLELLLCSWLIRLFENLSG